MSDLTRRKMQAEADANADINAKSFKHTSAYKIIASGIDPAVSPQINIQSGEAIRQQLLRRAKAKEMGLELSYATSGLSNNQYGKEAFGTYDKEKREAFLGKTDKDRERKKRERRFGGDDVVDTEDDNPAQSPYKRDSKSKDESADAPLKVGERPEFIKKAHERFGGSSNQPTRYNPYA